MTRARGVAVFVPFLRAIALFAVLPVLAAKTYAAEGPAAVPRTFYVEDIKAAMAKHIAATEDAEGTFVLRDDRSGEMLALQFLKIHDPVRRIDGDTYFACTDFRVKGEADKLYDVDFWLEPDGDVLVVVDTKVHKEPRHSLLYGWYKHPRYTFVDDEVVYLY